MRLRNINIYRIEYEVPPDMNSWTVIIAAGSPEEATAYIEKFWRKPCNFISIGQQTKLDAVSEGVIKQIMRLGKPIPVPPGKTGKVKTEGKTE